MNIACLCLDLSIQIQIYIELRSDQIKNPENFIWKKLNTWILTICLDVESVTNLGTFFSLTFMLSDEKLKYIIYVMCERVFHFRMYPVSHP